MFTFDEMRTPKYDVYRKMISTENFYGTLRHLVPYRSTYPSLVLYPEEILGIPYGTTLFVAEVNAFPTYENDASKETGAIPFLTAARNIKLDYLDLASDVLKRQTKITVDEVIQLSNKMGIGCLRICGDVINYTITPSFLVTMSTREDSDYMIHGIFLNEGERDNFISQFDKRNSLSRGV